MKVCVEGGNLRSGGGLTHVVELLHAVEPLRDGVASVHAYTTERAASMLPRRDWLHVFQGGPWAGDAKSRALWLRRDLTRIAGEERFDVIFSPGGICVPCGVPSVTMSRNMLPFQMRESLRYGISASFVRNLVRRIVQTRSFRRADGLIFLTDFAKRETLKKIGRTNGLVATVPHGVNERFFSGPRPQIPACNFSSDRPFRILYVSPIEPYKHHWNVVCAVERLSRQGMSVELVFAGRSGQGQTRLNASVKKLKKLGSDMGFLKIVGELAHEDLASVYRESDAFIFASTCENMPNTLLEAMASGLPIACSDRGPMPEVCREAALFFDPEDSSSIERALRSLLSDPSLRFDLASRAFERARQYSWTRCAQETFAFLAAVVGRRKTC